jgi:hypothetical protein
VRRNWCKVQAEGPDRHRSRQEDFKKAVAEKVTFEEFGYEKADWDAIQAVK